MTSEIFAEHSAIPAASVGIGFKPEHAEEALSTDHGLGFFEVHAENYMGDGGAPHRLLTGLREHAPLSVHGVALSIGGAGPLNREHLARLKRVIDRYEPALFSEHLAWSTHDGVYLNDLLPVPYNAETLARVSDHIDEVQETLQRRLLLENPSTYVAFESSTMSEVEFLAEVVGRTGCGLLLDVNNVYVSAVNHGTEPMAYLDQFPMEHVGEIHLGGHFEDRDDLDAPLLIDAHGTPVAEMVWLLYGRTLARLGATPTLIEWDNDVPAFSVLAAEAERALGIMAAETKRRQRRDAGASAPHGRPHAEPLGYAG
ncbi:MNIO family bufferin maturase [Methyloceanibacter sp.]|uniref:MNIO family bufferin maturase n=1 Tax=Methyloceanibacter sp. TaxID=1965321 RepID=UPI003D6D1614